MQKTSAELSSAVKNKNLNKQQLPEFGISILLQYFMDILRPNSIVFKGLENVFYNSIPRGNPD